MSEPTTTVKITKALQRRVAREAKARTPRTNVVCLATHYIETGVTADEAKRKEAVQ